MPADTNIIWSCVACTARAIRFEVIMKLAFLILVLLNLRCLLAARAFGRVGESGREPERVARQIEPSGFAFLAKGSPKASRGAQAKRRRHGLTIGHSN